MSIKGIKLNILFIIFVSLFVSCGHDVEIVSISCKDQKQEFVANEKFTPGKDFKLSVLTIDNSIKTVKAKNCEFFIDGNSAIKLKLKDVGQKNVIVKYKNAECDYNINISEKTAKIPSLFTKILTLIFIILLIVLIYKKKKKDTPKRYVKHKKNKVIQHNVLDIEENKNILSICKEFYETIIKSEDSTSISVNSRNVGHKIVKSVAKNEGFFCEEYEKSPGKILNDERFKKLMTDNIYKDFRYIIYKGNKAAHAKDKVLKLNEKEKQFYKQDLKNIIAWYEKYYCNN